MASPASHSLFQQLRAEVSAGAQAPVLVLPLIELSNERRTRIAELAMPLSDSRLLHGTASGRIARRLRFWRQMTHFGNNHFALQSL